MISGSINVVYKKNELVNCTLKNGDSFGESVIVKQPVRYTLNIGLYLVIEY